MAVVVLAAAVNARCAGEPPAPPAAPPPPVQVVDVLQRDVPIYMESAGRANVQAAPAGVVAADLDVSYTRIFSPTNGTIKTTVLASYLSLLGSCSGSPGDSCRRIPTEKIERWTEP